MSQPKQSESEADLIIRNGRVIDPANNFDDIADVAVKDGKILVVGKDLRVPSAEEFDARGCLVTPGLIDIHTHVYEHATYIGVNADRYCLSRGVTTVIDAGSAGAGNFAGLRKFIAEKCKTRILALCHISVFGLVSYGVGGGGCDSLTHVNLESCVKCIKENKDMIVGVKIRLSCNATNEGKSEQEAYRRAFSAAAETGLPLMAHHLASSVPLAKDNPGLSCPGNLRPGDIYTHCFHGLRSTIIDPDTRAIHNSVHEARARGVLFDIAHGRASFSWTVGEICAKEGFWPDIISTDLHSLNVHDPVYDLPTVMSKLLHLEMPLYDVIKAVTSTPAAAFGQSEVIGSLGVHRGADITVLYEEPCEADVCDSQGQLRRMKRRLVAKAVWRDGVRYETTRAEPFPNPEQGEESPYENFNRSGLVIKDCC